MALPGQEIRKCPQWKQDNRGFNSNENHNRQGWEHSTCLTSRSPWVQSPILRGKKGKNQEQKQEILYIVQPSHNITQYIIIRSWKGRVFWSWMSLFPHVHSEVFLLQRSLKPGIGTEKYWDNGPQLMHFPGLYYITCQASPRQDRSSRKHCQYMHTFLLFQQHDVAKACDFPADGLDSLSELIVSISRSSNYSIVLSRSNPLQL